MTDRSDAYLPDQPIDPLEWEWVCGMRDCRNVHQGQPLQPGDEERRTLRPCGACGASMARRRKARPTV